MRALVIGLIGLLPIAADAQIGCQKWADGSETCYYANGRIMEGRREIDGSTRWTENRRPAVATPGAAATDSGNQADTPDTMRGLIGNRPPSDERYINPWESQRPGEVENSRIGTPGEPIGHCRQWNAASPECDTRRR